MVGGGGQVRRGGTRSGAWGRVLVSRRRGGGQARRVGASVAVGRGGGVSSEPPRMVFSLFSSREV